MINSGIVKLVTGEVKDGRGHILQVGDSVMLNEQIITDSAGAIAIEFGDIIIDLGRNSNITINESMLIPEGETSLAVQAKEEAQDEVEAIKKALAEDESFDPSKLEAPAAGNSQVQNGIENDGHSLVDVKYINPQAIVDSGFQTEGINVGFFNTVEELILEPENTTDQAGNVATEDNEDIPTTTDTTAPSITLDEISEDVITTSERSEALTVSGATTGVEANQIVTISFNGQDYTGTVQNDGLFSITVPATDVAKLDDSTTYIAAGNVSDQAGNAATEDSEDVHTTDTTAPEADPVSTTSNLSTDTVSTEFPVSNIAFVKKFDIGGGLDGDLSVVENGIISDPADLGGQDLETLEPDLIFNLQSLPSYGDIYLLEDTTYIKVDASNIDSLSFTTVSEVYWVATHEQVSISATAGTFHDITFINGFNATVVANEGLTIKGYGLDGQNAKVIASNTNGLGIDSAGDRIGQIEFNNGKSETLLFDFNGPVTNSTIGVTHLIQSESGGEIGAVSAYLNGYVVGTWSFTANAIAEAYFSPTNGNVNVNTIGSGNGSGSVTFTLSDIVFDQLRFTGTEYQNQGSPVDSSDYFVAKISYNEIDNVNFKYLVADGAGNESATVDVAINVDTNTSVPVSSLNILGDDEGNTLIGGTGDDILTGGQGNDFLTGNDGADQFVWTKSDVSTGTVDTVADFNSTEGDVLNLADLLSDNSHTITAIDNGGTLQLKINSIDSTPPELVQTIDLINVATGGDADAILNQLLANGSINDGL